MEGRPANNNQLPFICSWPVHWLHWVC